MLKFKVKTKDFLRAIRIVENAIEDDKVNGQNSGIYIKSVDNKLEFRGVGFNLFIKCECNAEIIESGQVIIKYKLMEEFLRKLSEEFVEMTEDERNIKVVGSGSNASYKLIKYADPMEMSLLNGYSYKVNKKVLMDGIDTTMFAAANDASKTTINCTKFDIEENILKLVTTDSFRLMYKEVELIENESNKNISVSIPLKTSQSLLKIFKESDLDEVFVKIDGSKVLFKIDDIEILTKVVELQFPDYESILKNIKTDKSVKINSEAFAKKLDLVYLFVKDKKERKDVAEFIFNTNELEIIGFNDFAKVEQKIQISKDSEENIKMNLNTKYIIEYLSTLKRSTILEIKMSNEVSAILIKEDDETNNDIYLTMPLKM